MRGGYIGSSWLATVLPRSSRAAQLRWVCHFSPQSISSLSTTIGSGAGGDRQDRLLEDQRDTTSGMLTFSVIAA